MRVSAADGGFLLIYAVLISGIILTVGLGIIGTTVRSVQLAANGRESVKAFFAADAAVECVLHWDLRFDTETNFTITPFATSTDSGDEVPTSGVFCDGTDIAAQPWIISKQPTSATTVFTVTFNDGDANPDNNPFANVTVSKTGSGGNTEIVAEGYNSPLATYGRRVQRTVNVQY